MGSDLRRVLRKGAPSPTRPLEVERLIQEGRSRSRRRIIISAVASLAIFASAALAIPALLEVTEDRERPGPVATRPDTERTPAGLSAFADMRKGWRELSSPAEIRNAGASYAWTGQQLLVWGGYEFTGSGAEYPEASGFIYDAGADAWRAMAPAPLEARNMAAGAWTGSEFLVWGGWDGRDGFFADGAAYDPEADRWRLLPEAPISARAPLSVWTGEELLVWGTATRVDDRPRDGAAYSPRSNTWRLIAEAPIELTDATAVWTGNEMVVVGAALHGGNKAETPTAIAAAYDLSADAWRRLPDTDLSPHASTAAWDGSRVVAWDYGHHSQVLSPDANRWVDLPKVPLDDWECVPTSVGLSGHIVGDFCGAVVALNAGTDKWEAASPPILGPGWGFALILAEPAVLFLGRNVDTRERVFLAFRPSGDGQAASPDEPEVRSIVAEFLERRLDGSGAERYLTAMGREHFASAPLAPLYVEGPRTFEIVFVDQIGKNSWEVGIRWEAGPTETIFVGLQDGALVIEGGRPGLQGP